MIDTKQGGAGTHARLRRGATAAALEQVLSQARQAFGCDALGVLSWPGSAPAEVLGASGAAAHQAELLQVELAEGPAVRTGDDLGVVVSGDVRDDPRWRRWGPATARLGWSSVLTAPLDAADHRLGMLTLYSGRPGSWDATHAYAACLFGQYAATALAATADAAELREALERRHAQDGDVTLRAVSDHLVHAEHLVHTGLLPAAVEPQMRAGRRSPL